MSSWEVAYILKLFLQLCIISTATREAREADDEEEAWLAPLLPADTRFVRRRSRAIDFPALPPAPPRSYVSFCLFRHTLTAWRGRWHVPAGRQIRTPQIQMRANFDSTVLLIALPGYSHCRSLLPGSDFSNGAKNGSVAAAKSDLRGPHTQETLSLTGTKRKLLNAILYIPGGLRGHNLIHSRL